MPALETLLIFIFGEILMITSIKKTQWAIAFAWLFAVAGMGSTWYLNRVTFGPGGFTNYTAAAIRFDLAAIIAILVCVITKRTGRLNKQMVWLHCLAAVPMALFFVCIYTATQHILGGLAATIQSLSGVVMLCLSALVGREKISGLSWLGASLCLVGTAAIFLSKSSIASIYGLSTEGTAVLIMLGAAAAYALGSFVLRQKNPNDDALTSVMVLVTAEGIMLSIVAYCVQYGAALPSFAEIDRGPILALLCQVAFPTLGSFTSVIYLSTRVSMPVIASMTFVAPLVAIIVDRLFEQPELWVVTYTWTTFAGAGLILLGLVPVVWKKRSALDEKAMSPVLEVEAIALAAEA